MRVLIGSFSIPSEWTGAIHGHGAGISSGRLEGENLTINTNTRWEINPSYLVVEPEASRVWSITEPEQGGDLLCFEIGSEGQPVALLSRVATGCDTPCHLSMEPNLLFVCHYHGGAFSVIGRGANGLPTGVIAIVEPPASGDSWDRSSQRSRPHATLWLPGTSEFVVADCGRDTLLLYQWDFNKMSAALLDTLLLPPGTGPRHLAWHAKKGVIFVSDQNRGAVTVAERVISDGSPRLRHLQTLTVTSLRGGRVVPSEIAVHPSGDFVVMANRRDDSLTVLKVLSDGRVAEAATVDSGGAKPRHVCFSPDGSSLLDANQDSDEVVVLDVTNGSYREISKVTVATPTCICVWPGQDVNNEE